MTSKLIVNTIEADTGISSVSFASSISMDSTSKFHFSAAGIDIGADTNINRPAAGVIGFNVNGAEKLRIDTNGHLNTSGIATASNFKTGSSNLHSTGLTVGNNFIHTTGINVGTGATIHVPATNVLTLGTNSNERLRIDSSGRLLVGDSTATGAALVQVQKSSGDMLLVRNHATNYESLILSVASGTADIYASSGGSTSRPALRFITNDTEGLRIDSGGRIFTGNDTTLLNSERGSLHISGGGTSGSRVSIRGTATGAGNGLAEVFAFWDTNKVAGMIAFAGEDTTNKDDGKLNFYTADGGGVQARMKISKEGYVTKPNNPAFSAKGSTDAITAQSPLPYDSIDYNNGSHYNTSTYKFTVPVNGYYYVTCHVVPTNYTSGGNNVELYIKDDQGNRFFLDRKVKTSNYASNNFSVGGSRILYKTAGATLWIELNAISGSPTLEGSSHFGIMLMA